MKVRHFVASLRAARAALAGAALVSLAWLPSRLSPSEAAVAAEAVVAPVGDRERTRLAAGQLARTQLGSGLFVYDLDFATGTAEKMDDVSGPNIVRQALGAFALGEYLLDRPGDAPAQEALRMAIEAYAARSLPIRKGRVQTMLEDLGAYNLWRLWVPMRRPLNALGLLYARGGDGAVVSGNETYERAWPGATAFALIAELKYRAVTADERFADMRQRWLRGLFALGVPGRGFREAPHYLSESHYVNGEAWLALAEYVRAFPQDRATAAYLDGLDQRLVDRYAAKPDIHFYHWGVMASAVRAATADAARFRGFIREQTAWVLATQRHVLEGRSNNCFLVEGLATAFMSLRGSPADDDLIREVREWIDVAMAHNRALQILPGEDAVSLDDGRTVRSPLLAAQAGAFLLAGDVPTMQVDATAHCLSALVRMDRAGLTADGK